MPIQNNINRELLALDVLVGKSKTSDAVARVRNQLARPLYRLSFFVHVSKPSLEVWQPKPKGIMASLPAVFVDIGSVARADQGRWHHGVHYDYELLDTGFRNEASDENEETHIGQYRVTFLLSD